MTKIANLERMTAENNNQLKHIEHHQDIFEEQF